MAVADGREVDLRVRPRLRQRIQRDREVVDAVVVDGGVGEVGIAAGLRRDGVALRHSDEERDPIAVLGDRDPHGEQRQAEGGRTTEVVDPHREAAGERDRFP